MPDFSHVGVRGVWLNVQREFRPRQKISSGVSTIADFRHVDMEGQRKGELPVRPSLTTNGRAISGVSPIGMNCE